MSNALRFLRGLGVDGLAFGDLYLQDIRQYREQQFGHCGLELLFPLWGIPTRQLAEQMLQAGLSARLSCVDPRALPPEWAGREYDDKLLADLPPSVDPCAENGEFHTFVYAGPMFRAPIPIVTGESLERDGFIFADLLPAGANAAKPAEPAILAG
jgi:diphthamide synthase (EF-2-diphthine--ammonia ligase)